MVETSWMPNRSNLAYAERIEGLVKLTDSLNQGDLVYLTLRTGDAVRTCQGPNHEEGHSEFVARRIAIYQGNHPQGIHLSESVALVPWDYTHVKAEQLPSGTHVFGVRENQSTSACFTSIQTIDSLANAKASLVSDLKSECYFAWKHVQDPRMQALIQGRYQDLIDAL